MKDIISGDCLVSKIDIKSSQGQGVDLRKLVKFINIYESVMQPVLYGSMLVVDGVDILRGMPIIGEEDVDIEFETPTLDKVSLKMKCYAVTDVQIDEDKKLKTYTIHLISPEALTNSSKLINRKFTKENDVNASEVLKDDLSSEKEMEFAKTKGIDQQLVTNITPLQAIDKFRHRSVSLEYKSSSFVFYEDRKGFHFKTLEQMIKEGKKSGKHFVYDASNLVRDVRKSTARHIIGWKPIQHSNALDKIQSGSLKNKVKRYDLVTGDVVDYESGQNEFEATGSSAAAGSSAFNRQYGQSTSRTFLVPYNSDGDETFIAEKIGPLHEFVDAITENLVHAHIYGDSSLYVGDVISTSVSTGSALTEGERSQAAEGSYLVSQIRHMIINGDRPIYTQALELISNSYDY